MRLLQKYDGNNLSCSLWSPAGGESSKTKPCFGTVECASTCKLRLAIPDRATRPHFHGSLKHLRDRSVDPRSRDQALRLLPEITLTRLQPASYRIFRIYRSRVPNHVRWVLSYLIYEIFDVETATTKHAHHLNAETLRKSHSSLQFSAFFLFLFSMAFLRSFGKDSFLACTF